MTQSDFARLCGVSKQMVSKYAAAGYLHRSTNGRVFAKESLQLLEGTLNEAKRRAALMKLAGIEFSEAPSKPEAIEREPLVSKLSSTWNNNDSQADDTSCMSWKTKKDRAMAQMAELDLAERMGKLVEAEDVRLAAADAVACFFAEVERSQRYDADNISAELNMSVDNAVRLRQFLKNRDLRIRAEFAESMKRAAEKAAPEKGRREIEKSGERAVCEE